MLNNYTCLYFKLDFNFVHRKAKLFHNLYHQFLILLLSLAIQVLLFCFCKFWANHSAEKRHFKHDAFTTTLHLCTSCLSLMIICKDVKNCLLQIIISPRSITTHFYSLNKIICFMNNILFRMKCRMIEICNMWTSIDCSKNFQEETKMNLTNSYFIFNLFLITQAFIFHRQFGNILTTYIHTIQCLCWFKHTSFEGAYWDSPPFYFSFPQFIYSSFISAIILIYWNYYFLDHNISFLHI